MMDKNKVEENKTIEKKHLNQTTEIKNSGFEKDNIKFLMKKKCINFIIVTLIISFILNILFPGTVVELFLSIYLTFLSFFVYLVGIFLFLTKNMLPGLNWSKIRLFLSIVRGLYVICTCKSGTSEGLVIFPLELFLIPLLCGVGYLFSCFIEKVYILINQIRKGEKIAVISKGGLCTLIILIILVIIYLCFK